MQNAELLLLTSGFLTRIERLKKDDILLLREVIREHNRLYHEEESPIISDVEYDALFHALARLEADNNMIDEDSPTARLAILASGQFQKVKHLYPMISLDNTYNMEEVREWNERMRRILKTSPQPCVAPSSDGVVANHSFLHLSPKGEGVSENPPSLKKKGLGDEVYYIQPKFDGLGLAVIYEYGKLSQAITRGSGVEGEDVTLTAFEIENLPKDIPALRGIERMEVRGEVMMSRTVFEQVNHERLQTGEKLFANPRNCASGSLRQLDPLVTRSRRLQFFAYAIPQIEQGLDTRFGVNQYHAMMDLLESWGFCREDFPYFQFYGLTIEDIVKTLTRETENRREYFDFDIDGVVLKLDDMTLWDELGRTEHHPRYAIAYKFPAKQVRTRVISIEHSVGRTGTVTPVANLEPVEVTGVIVRRATLHNYDELTKKGVREGDYVYIVRAGEVIPEIVSVITEVRTGGEKEVHPPKNCPICTTSLMQDEGKVAIFCPNRHCPAQIQGRLEVFCGKQGLNIDGLGTKQIELFLELGWITDFASIFHLHEYREQFFELEGYKEKSVNNLIESIEKARNTTLERAIVSLGIPNIGKKTAKVISSFIHNHGFRHPEQSEGSRIESTETLDSSQGSEGRKHIIPKVLFSLTEEELLEIKDIGPETAHAFVEYMEDNREIVEGLFNELTISESTNKPTNQQTNKLFEKSFCVTGSFEGISRDEIHELIEKNGGEVRTSVSNKLNYLIVGSEAGSKLEKAKELGVNILSIEEFQKMLPE